MVKVLIPVVGLAAFELGLPIAGAITALLVLLVLSYRQTIKAYPSAGGAYIVTKDNFGLLPAQVAGVALLLDYVMTVAVSIAAAVAAIYSYFPAFFSLRVPLALAFVWLVTLSNLRGLRMTGRLFATPTYLFLASIAALLLAGAVNAVTGGLHPIPPPPGVPAGSLGVAGVLLIMHAYASGTTALTGVEAISNGVPVFRPVEWRNARTVLTWMGTILAVSFAGITALAWKLHPVPTSKKTLVSEMGAALFGHSWAGRAGQLVLQVATTAILVLAANTSFADFPRLASFHAGDGYLPRPLRRRGRRLAFSVGILSLAALASVVILLLGADVHRLIPLYAVGVFASFTFSQMGMTRRHLRLREEGWRRGLALNAAGAVGSTVALVAILVSKFVHGAWAVVVIVPAGVALFVSIHRHYERADAWLSDPATGATDWGDRPATAVVLAGPEDPELSWAAVAWARRLRPGAGVEEASRGATAVKGKGPDPDPDARAGVTLIVLPRRAGDPDPRPWSRPARLRRRHLRSPDVAVATVVLEAGTPPAPTDRHAAVVVVDRADAVARRGLALARLLHPDEIHAVRLDLDTDETDAALDAWPVAAMGVELEILPAPYREPGGPLRTEAEALRRRGNQLVTVIAPTLAPRWWQRPLYATSTRSVRSALGETAGTAVIEHRMPLRPPAPGQRTERRRAETIPHR
jgi:amino acid transporter